MDKQLKIYLCNKIYKYQMNGKVVNINQIYNKIKKEDKIYLKQQDKEKYHNIKKDMKY